MALLLAMSLLFAAPASLGPDQVLVLREPARGASARRAAAGFLEALSIELAGSARVRRGPQIAGDTTASRIDYAASKIAAPVRLVVWLEVSGDELVLYTVARSDGRPRVDTFRQPATGGPEIDRALALKVHDVLDRVQLGRGALGPATAPTVPPRLSSSPAVAISAELELATRALTGSAGSQLGAGVGLAAGMRASRMSAQMYALAYLASGVSASRAVGTIEVDEWGAGGGLRLLAHRGRAQAGLGLELSGRHVFARGTTLDGVSGSYRAWLASLSPFAEARYSLTGDLSLRAALGVDVALTRPRFSLEQVTVLDLGRLRGRMDVSMILRLR